MTIEKVKTLLREIRNDLMQIIESKTDKQRTKMYMDMTIKDLEEEDIN